MFEILIAGAVGALWANSRAPRTRIIKSTVIGPTTGHKWQVEFFEELGVMVVIHGGSKAAFRRTPEGWKLARSVGDPGLAELAKKDFEK